MGLFSAAADFVGNLIADEIIAQGLDQALITMERMIVNEGQQSVFDVTIAPDFESNAEATVDEGWVDVDAGPYSDFMGEICETGNSIMQQAYDQAKKYAEELQII